MVLSEIDQKLVDEGYLWVDELGNLVKKEYMKSINRYRRKRPKLDASIFDSVLSQTRRPDASEKKRRK